MFGIRLRVLVASLVMLLGPASVSATPAEDEAALKLARTYYQHGETRFQDGDYVGAVQEYSKSLTILPTGPAHELRRARALWSLVRAREASHEQRGALEQLCAAEGELAEVSRMKLTPDLEIQRPAMDALAQKIAALCHPPEPVPVPEPEPVSPPPVSDNLKPQPPPSVEQVPDEVPAPVLPDTSPRQPGRPLLVAGGIVTGLGIAAFGGMTASLLLSQQAEQRFSNSAPGDERRDLFRDGSRANLAAMVTAVIGGVATLTGVTLLAVGRHRGKTGRVAVSPLMHPRAAALLLRFSF